MPLSTINEWQSYIASIHNKEIELGLDRVKQVAERLGLLKISRPAIIVGGTNGKGSTVAGLDAIYRAAGYNVGTFTSPYLLRFNELVKINGRELSDEAWCSVFAEIEANRGTTSLTPFEFHTLGALAHFQKQPLDLLILEVGLGGRLDAVNIIDADVAIVTSIALDHTDRLGPTRETIAHEKAGIFRSGKYAVCGDEHPPITLLDDAHNIGARLFRQKKDFYYSDRGTHWSWHSGTTRYEKLPNNALLLQNMSTVLMAVELLQNKLPVKRTSIDRGLASVSLSGRMQIIPGSIPHVFDVSHNPAAAGALANRLATLSFKKHAIFSMLGDKDIASTIKAIEKHISSWHVAALPVERGASQAMLQAIFQQLNMTNVTFYPTIQAAYQTGHQSAREGEGIVVFGSFHTVSGIQSFLNSEATRAKIDVVHA